MGPEPGPQAADHCQEKQAPAQGNTHTRLRRERVFAAETRANVCATSQVPKESKERTMGPGGSRESTALEWWSWSQYYSQLASPEQLLCAEGFARAV